MRSRLGRGRDETEVEVEDEGEAEGEVEDEVEIKLDEITWLAAQPDMSVVFTQACRMCDA